jgi:hypothetical protein
VLALQVKISSGSKIYQALLNALVVPTNHAQGTIKFVQCTTNACLRCHRFRRADCFQRITNHASRLFVLGPIIDSVLAEMQNARCRMGTGRS